MYRVTDNIIIKIFTVIKHSDYNWDSLPIPERESELLLCEVGYTQYVL